MKTAVLLGAVVLFPLLVAAVRWVLPAAVRGWRLGWRAGWEDDGR